MGDRFQLNIRKNSVIIRAVLLCSGAYEVISNLSWKYSIRIGFLNNLITDIQGQIILCCQGLCHEL